MIILSAFGYNICGEVNEVKISSKEECGIRCMIQLASRGGESEVVTVKEIAEHEGLSAAYVGKLLWALSRSGLTESVRGVDGGYRLARPAEEISLGEIVRALSGNSKKAGFCGEFPGGGVVCAHDRNCSLQPLWSRIMLYVQNLLDETPLSDLIQRERSVRKHAASS
ncbi:MAG: RrF2 family transcriptional regulator [Armatimonadota bacterium]